MKNLYESILAESIFAANAQAASEISKKFGYEDKGDYEQAYMYNYNGITNGYIIWPKSNKVTIYITSKMIESLQTRLKHGIILYICPIGGKKLYDKGDITLHFDSKISDDQGDLYIVWGGSKRGMLTIDGADFLLNELNISSNDNIKLYPQISSIFDFIALPDDKDKAAISSPSSSLHKVLDNKYNITLSSNITSHYIDARGARSTTVTIYGDLANLPFEYESAPYSDFGKAKVIDKSNNAIFGLPESLDDVKTKWHPKAGLFSEKDPQAIASYLLSHSKTPGQAMQRLVFYMNRAGDDCPNKTVLNKVKNIIHNKES